MTPLNANARGLTGRRGILSNARSYHACPHDATVIERMPSTHKHYAREVCASCGAHRSWVAKPRNVERRRLNGFRLVKLSVCPRLKPWEANFVRNVLQLRKFSPRQQAVIDRLTADYLEEPYA
jgi:hypothetical protein